MENIAGLVQDFVISAVVALVIFFIGKWVARQIANLVQRILVHRSVDVALVSFVTSIVYWALLIFVTIAALGRLGLQTASFVAIIGAAGLAVGLALQGSLANFASGVLILIFKPFKVGDFVEVAGTAGVVKTMQIFTTELSTGDNKHVIIPNANVTGGVITQR